MKNLLNGIPVTAKKNENTQETFEKIIAILRGMHLIQVDETKATNLKNYEIRIIELD